MMSQEDHARQATLHHFAGQHLSANGHDLHPRQALKPALAELVGSIEQRCVQLEDKADEVTSSLQVRYCFDLRPSELSQPQLDCCWSCMRVLGCLILQVQPLGLCRSIIPARTDV